MVMGSELAGLSFEREGVGEGSGGWGEGAGESFTAPRREIRGMMPQIITLRGHIHF